MLSLNFENQLAWSASLLQCHGVITGKCFKLVFGAPLRHPLVSKTSGLTDSVVQLMHVAVTETVSQAVAGCRLSGVMMKKLQLCPF